MLKQDSAYLSTVPRNVRTMILAVDKEDHAEMSTDIHLLDVLLVTISL